MDRWAPLRVTVEGRDEHRAITGLAVCGLLAGAVMALVGLPPVDVHGPLHYLGIMDPFCGGTRSVQSLMSGDFSMAWRYNPIAFPLVAGAFGVLARHAVGLGTGRWVTVRLGDRRVFWGVLAALLIALGVNQQLHADLLQSSPDRLSFLGPLITGVVPAGLYLVLRRHWHPDGHRRARP